MSPLHVVYRMYGSDGRLLYVGISERLYERMRRHFFEKPWITEVARVQVEHAPTEAQARCREQEIIETEHPVYNIVGQRESIPNLPRIDLLLAILGEFHQREYPY